MPRPVPGREYLLYAHIPFCTRLCPYCSFNRFPFEAGRARAYFKTLRDEMRQVAEQGFTCTSMYVGGGTPTVIVDELVETIELAHRLFPIREVSSETNPDHLTEEIVSRLEGLVDRFSVGVQSFDDSLLKQMERYDKYGSGEEILARIQRIAGRFHSLNVDMIFNFPSQTEAMLRRDIEMLKASGTNQTTFYPLMASPVVERSLAATVGKVDYAREARFYEIISAGLTDAAAHIGTPARTDASKSAACARALERAGTFEPASSWTFSRTGGGMIDEYIVDYEDYVGIGSGAFSFLDGAILTNTFSLAEYAERVAAGRCGVTQSRTFGHAERMRYRFMMGLFGLSLDKRAFARDFGTEIEHGLPAEMAFMRTVGAFSVDDAERLELTPKGRYLLVAMMRQFFISVNSLRDQARESLSGSEKTLLFGDGDKEDAGKNSV
ncbi:MAG: radical SAM protein [Coriobacteriia bacterium]|nr:radical SAM protein [Coriobacteriia bacterium]